MKYLCIKSYWSGIKGKFIFNKGERYTVYDDSKSFHIVYYNICDMWRVPDSRFKEHFSTIQELREIEINKILN